MNYGLTDRLLVDLGRNTDMNRVTNKFVEHCLYGMLEALNIL